MANNSNSNSFLSKREILGVIGPVLERPDDFLVVKDFCKSHMQNFESSWEDLVEEAHELADKNKFFYEDLF